MITVPARPWTQGVQELVIPTITAVRRTLSIRFGRLRIREHEVTSVAADRVEEAVRRPRPARRQERTSSSAIS
jgi:aminoglycoside N3'-acetyltransferase